MLRIRTVPFNIRNVAVILMILRMFLGSATKIFTIPDVVDWTIILVSAILIVIDFINRQLYSKKELTLVTLVSLVTIVSAFLSGEFTLMYSVLLIFAVGREDITEFLKGFLPLKVFLVILIILLYIAGIAFGSIAISTKNGFSSFTGGFETGNVFAFVIFWLVMEYMYTKRHDLSIPKIILCSLMQLFVARISGCKTVLCLSIISCIVLIFLQFRKMPKVGTLFSRFGFVIVGALYYACVSIFYSGSGALYYTVYFVDNFLTGRIRNTAYLVSKYGVTIWGNYVQKGTIEYDTYYQLTRATVDGGYALLFLQAGVVYFILISIGFVLLYKKYKCDDFEIWTICLFIVYNLSEVFVMNAFICFPVLLLGKVIFDREKYGIDIQGDSPL